MMLVEIKPLKPVRLNLYVHQIVLAANPNRNRSLFPGRRCFADVRARSGLRFALALASGHARDTESIECNSRLVDQCQPAFTRGSQRMAVFESRLFRFMQAGAVRLPIHARARQSASPLTSHPHRSHGRVYLDVVAELGQNRFT